MYEYQPNKKTTSLLTMSLFLPVCVCLCVCVCVFVWVPMHAFVCLLHSLECGIKHTFGKLHYLYTVHLLAHIFSTKVPITLSLKLLIRHSLLWSAFAEPVRPTGWRVEA